MDRELFYGLIRRYAKGEYTSELVEDINSAINEARVKLRGSLSRRMSKDENAQVIRLVHIRARIRVKMKAA